jgi:hypothetical protein
MNYVDDRVLRVLPPVLTWISPMSQSKELSGQRKP